MTRLPAELPAAHERCAKCGACTAVCPVYRATGRESLSPRGKIHLLTRGGSSQALAGILSQCLLCGACQDACPRGIATPALVVEARSALSGWDGPGFFKKRLTRTALNNAAVLAGALRVQAGISRLLERLPPESGLRLKLAGLTPAAWFPSVPEQGFLDSLPHDNPFGEAPSYAYFAGCLANHLCPEIGRATMALADKTMGSALFIPAAQTCCGMPALAIGDKTQSRELAIANIKAFASHNGPILTSCASCYAHMRTYPELFRDDAEWGGRAQDFAARLTEFSSFFLAAPGIKERSGTLFVAPSSAINVFYHDPCHLRFGERIIAPPRQLLSVVPGVCLKELPSGPQCCGHGGLFHLAHPGLSKKILSRPLADLRLLGLDQLVTTCSGCLLQWREGLHDHGLSIKASHLAVFLAERLQP